MRLDGDGNYCWSAFPARSSSTVETICSRIGANNKYELQVGPSLPDYVSGCGTRNDGIVCIVGEHADVSVGRMLNQHCMIVAVNKSLGFMFVAPMERVFTPPLPKEILWQTDYSSVVIPNEKPQPPSTWQMHLGPFVDVLNTEEGTHVIESFYDQISGLKPTECSVESIQRVQGEI